MSIVRRVPEYQHLHLNVFSVNDKNNFYPLRMAEKDCQTSETFEKAGKQHYSLIKHFNRLFRSQITSQTNAPVYIFKKCFTNFTKKELFDKHIQYCLRNETVAVKMPEKITFLNSKIFPIDFRYLLLFMQTLNVSQNHFKHVSLLLMNLIRIRIKNKSEFYSKLNDEHISDEDYLHALTVWKTFKCKTIKDFHDLYLKSDVLLLADLIENFRKICLEYYKLDPAHYFTAPGLAWYACLSFFTIMTC